MTDRWEHETLDADVTLPSFPVVECARTGHNQITRIILFFTFLSLNRMSITGLFH